MTRPWPLATRSHATSVGSLPPISFEICAIDLPSYFALLESRALASTMFSQPPDDSMMFHHPGEPLFTSRFRRARISGLLKRARSESPPPSCAQLGIVASRPVPPAV